MRDQIGIFVLQFYHCISTAELFTRKISQASSQAVNHVSNQQLSLLYQDYQNDITVHSNLTSTCAIVVNTLVFQPWRKSANPRARNIHIKLNLQQVLKS